MFSLLFLLLFSFFNDLNGWLLNKTASGVKNWLNASCVTTGLIGVILRLSYNSLNLWLSNNGLTLYDLSRSVDLWLSNNCLTLYNVSTSVDWSSLDHLSWSLNYLSLSGNNFLGWRLDN